ncbi:FHA domain-containing protein [Anabaena minutissima FACHB-250]|nr:FHA domain-containing protein [Anabaena minutissima FACHB-250]
MYSLEILLVEERKKYTLDKSLVIGRGVTSDIYIPLKFISRCHCTLILMPENSSSDRPYYLLKDGHILGESSANGTWVNGERVKGFYYLKHHDLITFGGEYPQALFVDECATIDAEESKATSGFER